jgi:hypothetical protein
MTDIGAFPTITKVLYNSGPTETFIAGETIKAGQVVGNAATGVERTVVVMDATPGEYPIGVACNGGTVGQPINVALDGALVTVANEDDTTGIEAGDFLEVGTLGTVLAISWTAAGVTTTQKWLAGRAESAIAGSGTGLMRVKTGPATVGNSA